MASDTTSTATAGAAAGVADDSDGIFIKALTSKNVTASVIDMDFRRHHGVSIATDYIIAVESKNSSFDTYHISKQYTDFRSLAKKFDDIVEKATQHHEKWDELTPEVKSIISLTGTLNNYVDSQKHQYLGKVNFNHVKQLAKIRSEIINGMLEEILKRFPKAGSTNSGVQELESTIRTFLLTDICVEDDDDDEDDEELDNDDEMRSSARLSLRGLGKKIVPKDLTTHLPSVKPKTPDAPKYKKVDSNNHSVIIASTKPSVTNEIEGEGAAGAAAGGGCVKPITRKRRTSVAVRQEEIENLNLAASVRELTMADHSEHDDEEQAAASKTAKAKATTTLRKPTPAKKKKPSSKKSSTQQSMSEFINDNPVAFFGTGLILSLVISRHVSGRSISIDADTFILLLFAAYCLGFHTPGSTSTTSSTAPPSASTTKEATSVGGGGGAEVTTVARLAQQQQQQQKRRSSLAAHSLSMKRGLSASELLGEEPGLEEEEYEEEEEEETVKGPFPLYPEGADLGEYHNCWSQPPSDNFHVRGPKYLSDRKKVPSKDFVFPARGVDLFITDLCPENVGSNPGVFGGHLRDKPTFLLNFRLPWGVLVFYTEIPERLLPFLYKCYEPHKVDESTMPNIDDMESSSDRTVARWLMGDNTYKDKRLKIVPVVVRGPWIVKSVVGGKPAIIGTKMPVKYFYEPADPDKNKSCYLEVDFDIVSSAAARGILSVAGNAASVLTMDLGFVIESQAQDELPEQMLTGQRLHGIDPLTAPPLPPMKDLFANPAEDESSSSEDD